MAEGRRKLTVGFKGGQVLPLRLSPEAFDSLESALEGGGWHSVEDEDGTVRLNLDQVVYLRVDSDEPRVGFS